MRITLPGGEDDELTVATIDAVAARIVEACALFASC